MLDIFTSFATDETAEVNGTWLPFNGAKLLVARAGNRKYAKALTKKVETFQKELDAQDDAADKRSDEIMAEVFAESILLGWEGIGFKGAPMDYSKDNAKTLLLVKDFRRAVAALSDDMNNYRVKVEAEQVKN